MKRLTIQGMMALVAALALLCAVVAQHYRFWYLAPEAARRTKCINNLKQIGQSIAYYAQEPERYVYGKYGVYPSGTIPDPKIIPEGRFGWATLIYLMDDEGCSGCPAIDTYMAWDDPRQEGASGRDMEMYCPSCPRVIPAKRFVPAAYIGIAGFGVDAPCLPTTDKRAGIFGDDRVVAPSDVTDGQGQTMMIAESSAPAGPWFAGGRNTVRGLDPARQPYIGMRRQFGGIHAGGANVLMADGSVRFITDSVDPKVFEALSTIAGGEKISVP